MSARARWTRVAVLTVVWLALPVLCQTVEAATMDIELNGLKLGVDEKTGSILRMSHPASSEAQAMCGVRITLSRPNSGKS